MTPAKFAPREASIVKPMPSRHRPAFEAFAANIMSHHSWPVCWRGKSGDNHVMNLMTGSRRLNKSASPLRSVQLTISLGGQPMAIRQQQLECVHSKATLTCMRKMRFAGHDRDVDCAVAQSSDKTRAGSFYHSEFELRKSSRIIHKRRAQIGRPSVMCKSDREPASFTAAGPMRLCQSESTCSRIDRAT